MLHPAQHDAAPPAAHKLKAIPGNVLTVDLVILPATLETAEDHLKILFTASIQKKQSRRFDLARNEGSGLGGIIHGGIAYSQNFPHASQYSASIIRTIIQQDNDAIASIPHTNRDHSMRKIMTI
jgi:hypothetical protein